MEQVKDILLGRGRIRRRTFVLLVTVLVLWWAVPMLRWTWLDDTFTVVVFWLLWTGMSRRFQDRGWPGRPLAAATVVAFLLLAFALDDGVEPPYSWTEVLGLCALLGTLLVVLAAAVIRGSAGDNRYGPDPRAKGAS